MNIKKIIIFLCVYLSVIIYFFNAEYIVAYVSQAVYVCVNTLIPSLYIFMVITTYISSLNMSEIICIPFIPFFRMINITDKKIISYCVLSILGGFATGGYFLSRIEKEFDCETNLKLLLPVIMSNNSPAFIIIAIGQQIFGNIKTGIILYAAVILSSYITAFIFSFIFPFASCQKHSFSYKNIYTLNDAVKISVTSILNICGVVIFTFTVCKVAQLYIKNQMISAVAAVLCEVTTGCSIIFDIYGKNLYFICLALTILPLSAFFQMKSFENNKRYSFKALYLSKLIQMPLSIIILRILINIFPVISSVYSNGDISVTVYRNSLHISLYMFILSIFFIIFFDKKIKVFTKQNK